MSHWDEDSSSNSGGGGGGGGAFEGIPEPNFSDAGEAAARPPAAGVRGPAGRAAGPAGRAGAPGPASHWTPEQLVRLENEWRRLQRSFAYHPHVRVVPLKGDPPDEYQIEYRLRTLVMADDGTLEYAATCAVHVWLGPNFPHEPPLVRPISPLFHPNIVPQGINIDRAWTGPSSTLADVVRAVGAMVALQDYDVDAVWNEMAMEWILANPGHVPVDMEANLAFDAGGEPLARVIRFGPRTLEQVRTQLKQTCDALIAPEGGAPTAREVAAAAARTRQALGLFLEDDVPDSIRGPASELDEWARFLPETDATWAAIRQYRGAAATAFSLAQQMKEGERALAFELAAVDALVDGPTSAGDAAAPTTPAEALRRIPPASKLQLHQGNLDNLLARAQEVAAEARQAAARLSALTPIPRPSAPGLLARRLEAEMQRAESLAVEGGDRLREAYGKLEPVYGRAVVHAAALRRMTQWREYADLVARAEALANRLVEWGAAGLQAYFVEDASGRRGPFELERRVELGGAAVAVRNPASTVIELVDADAGALIRRGDEGVVAKGLVDPAKGGRRPTTFRLTGNCDELAVQMGYLHREAGRLLAGILEPVRSPAEGWMASFNEILGAAVAGGRVKRDHDAMAARWATLRDDVASLRPFKERLATLRMLQRVAAMAPKLLARRDAAAAALDEATERLSVIVAGSNTDLETGRLLIPQKWAKEYPEQLRRRDQAKADIALAEQQMALAAEDVRRRVGDAGLLGFADRPALAVLGGWDEAWDSALLEMTDAAIEQKLEELSRLLGRPVKPDVWPPGSDLRDDGPRVAGRAPARDEALAAGHARKLAAKEAARADREDAIDVEAFEEEGR